MVRCTVNRLISDVFKNINLDVSVVILIFLYYFIVFFKSCSTEFLFPESFTGHTAAQTRYSLPLSRVVVVSMQLSAC